MDQRDIFTQTVFNMYNIYTDIGRIIQVIEEEIKNNNLIAVSGDASVTWENSSAYYKPESWLQSWFARAYYYESLKSKVVGFCIHLGGERYQIEEQERLEAAGIHFPFMNVSVIETDINIKQEVKRNTLNNIFWSAGWYESALIRCVENERLVLSYGDDDDINGNAKLSTYFLDLLTLNSKDAVINLAVEPMVKMLAGSTDWIIKNDLPVIKINQTGSTGE